MSTIAVLWSPYTDFTSQLFLLLFSGARQHEAFCVYRTAIVGMSTTTTVVVVR